METKKMYKTAPLPFQGQKRRFVNGFAAALKLLADKQDVRLVVDLFGGSGLLSHTAKHVLPGCKVIYNDFDNYSQRLNNIGFTNRLLSDIRVIARGLPGGEKIDNEYRHKILDRILVEDNVRFVDYITLSSSLLFSAKYVTCFENLKKETLYNNIKTCDYICDADEYLSGLDIVSVDYKELYNLYKGVPGVLFLIDPPYLSTDTSTYHSDKYWKLRDYLDVLRVLVGTNYVRALQNTTHYFFSCFFPSS